MSNGSVQWFLEQLQKTRDWQRVINEANQSSSSVRDVVEQAKEMEVMGKEMSYADGYAEGYKRALEVMEWYIKNHISGMPQDHIVDTNKPTEEVSNDKQ
jgi:hypothetical protein